MADDIEDKSLDFLAEKILDFFGIEVSKVDDKNSNAWVFRWNKSGDIVCINTTTRSGMPVTVRWMLAYEPSGQDILETLKNYVIEFIDPVVANPFF